MCEHYKLECTTLKQYIKQRGDLIKATGLDKSTFKKLFFSAVLYHPQCTDEQLQHKLNKFNLDTSGTRAKTTCWFCSQMLCHRCTSRM